MLAVHEDRLAAAVARLGSENAFEILARARELEAAGRRVVHMEIGEPDFDTPAEIKKAAVDALYDNHTHYTPSSGLLALRETIADYASRFRDVTPAWNADNVVISPGAKPVIWNTLSALLNPGDDFIYFDPAYPAYASAASYLEANVHAIPLRESRNWRMDLDELARRVSAKTKLVVINSPHNPTGGVLTRGDLEFIAEPGGATRFSRSRRRDLQPQLLPRHAVFVDLVAAGHARANDRRQRFLEGLCDDRLAARLCDPAATAGTHGDALQQQHV